MSAEPAVPSTRTNLKSEVATHVREEIFAGRMRPGARVDQDRLAERLGMSKIPVREALVTLEAEGLLVSYPRRGAFVAPITREDVRDHFEVFGAVSAIAAARAARTLTPADVDVLDHLLDRMRATRDDTELDRLNDELHRTINRAGSRRLRSVLALLAHSMAARFFATADASDREPAHADHAAIVEAVRAGDGDAAAEATRRHFERSGEVAMRALEARRFWEE